MSILDDLSNEIQSYAANHVVLEILEPLTWPGTSGAANEGDTTNFRIRVRNNGNMDIKQLKLHVRGSQYGKVAVMGMPPQFKDYFITGGIDIVAHGSRTVGPFLFNAEKNTNGTSEEIFNLHVHAFDLNWEHLLLDHTGHAAAASDSYSENILAT